MMVQYLICMRLYFRGIPFSVASQPQGINSHSNLRSLALRKLRAHLCYDGPAFDLSEVIFH